MQNVMRKRRVLTSGILLDTADLPAFPSGPTDGVMKFAGDMAGAAIGGLEWIVAGTFDLTTLDGKLQHSDDGVTWHDVDASVLKLAQLAAVGSEFVHVPDTASYSFKRFLRIALTAGAAGTTTTVEVALYYDQVGAPGHLAYAGLVDGKE